MLTFIKEDGVDKYRYKCGVYSCYCGKEFRQRISSVNSGKVLSCGCLQKEKVSKKVQGINCSVHPLYETYRNMKQRCSNINHKKYHRYGGRGIKVCDEWINSFETYVKDIGESPFKGAQVDRRDNDKGYYPENCRWVTPKVNSNNRSHSKKA